MVTGVDDIRVGIEAMKNGADDYLVKPLQLEVIVQVLGALCIRSGWSKKSRITVGTLKRWWRSGPSSFNQRSSDRAELREHPRGAWGGD